MRLKCYFCNNWLNNSTFVRMYDGRNVKSCYTCRGLVADAKPKSTHHHSENNSVLGIVGGDKID